MGDGDGSETLEDGLTGGPELAGSNTKQRRHRFFTQHLPYEVPPATGTLAWGGAGLESGAAFKLKAMEGGAENGPKTA